MTKFQQSRGPARTPGSARGTGATARPSGARGRGQGSALRVATYGVLAALALIFGYLEALLPLPIPVPGIKLGLGNVVVLYALTCLGEGPGLAVMVVKVVASSLLFGSPTVFMYSFAGALASFAVMSLALRWSRLSLLGVSMLGGVAHMLGQLVVVGVVLTWQVAAFYLPVLVVAGLASGAVVGILCRLAIRATRNSAVLRDQRKRMRAAAAGERAVPAAPAGVASAAGSRGAAAGDAKTTSREGRDHE
ncbi:MAG: Gx transporter family protein [Coriobacteriales bacterium]